MNERARQAWRLAGLLGGAVLVYLVVRFRSKAVQDAALVAGFLYAVIRGGARWRAWLTPGGLAALGVLAYSAIQIPFGADPSESFRLLLKHSDLVLFLVAVPVLFHTPARLMNLLLACALAVTGVLLWDLVRLVALLGPRLLAEARYTEPYILTHPNIAAMGAVVAIVVLACGVRHARWEPVLRVVCVLALLVNLAYLFVIASRGPQLALLAAVGAGVVPRLDRRARWVAIVAGLAIVVLLPVMNPRFRDAFSGGALVDRDKAWFHTLELVQQRSLLGYGYGEEIFMRAYHTATAPDSPHKFHHPHQYWLNVLFVQGALGGALHIVMWGLLAHGLLQRMRDRHAPGHRLAGLALTLMIALHVYSLVDLPTNIVAVAMLMAVPVAVTALARERAA